MRYYTQRVHVRVTEDQKNAFELEAGAPDMVREMIDNRGKGAKEHVFRVSYYDSKTNNIEVIDLPDNCRMEEINGAIYFTDPKNDSLLFVIREGAFKSGRRI